MQFLNLSGAWALVALSFVLALYMLRRRHERAEVPSVYLWRLAMRSSQVERPIEKLKKNLLMFIQLLLALLIALSLMRPVISGGMNASEVMLIFDVSASMQAEADGVSRIELARREASRIVDTLSDESRVSIVLAGGEVTQLTSFAYGKQQILRAINSIEAENGGSQLAEALSLARAIKREMLKLQIVVFSDDYNPTDESGISFIPVGLPVDNRALVSLTATMSDAGGRALARVANYGDDASLTLECYADGILCDVKGLELPAGEILSVRFELPEGAEVVSACIVEIDALSADNERVCVIGHEVRSKIVFAGKDDIFLEKALNLTGAELYKTTVAEAATIDDAELYVFDSELPDELPEKGALLIVNPPEDVPGFELGEEAGGGALSAASYGTAQAFSQGLTFQDVSTRSFRPVTGGDAFLLIGGQPAAAYAEMYGRKIAVIGFDLHDSNLPMKYDFPVLMNNLLGALLPDALSLIEDAVCGQRFEFNLSARAESAEVITPSGKSVTIAPPFPALPLTDTDEIGLYTLNQELNGRVESVRFSLSIPQKESDVRTVSEPVSFEGEANVRYGRDLTGALLLLLIGLMLVEWWVSRRAD